MKIFISLVILFLFINSVWGVTIYPGETLNQSKCFSSTIHTINVYCSVLNATVISIQGGCVYYSLTARNDIAPQETDCDIFSEIIRSSSHSSSSREPMNIDATYNSSNNLMTILVSDAFTHTPLRAYVEISFNGLGVFNENCERDGLFYFNPKSSGTYLIKAISVGYYDAYLSQLVELQNRTTTTIMPTTTTTLVEALDTMPFTTTSTYKTEDITTTTIGETIQTTTTTIETTTTTQLKTSDNPSPSLNLIMLFAVIIGLLLLLALLKKRKEPPKTVDEKVFKSVSAN